MSSADPGWTRAFAPATVSNVTCGFDLLGFAVEEWGDVVEARRSAAPGVRLTAVTGDEGRLPSRAGENTAGVAALHLLRAVGGEARGVDLRLHKGLPLASGLGSSGASAVAAAVAVDAALGLGASRELLLAAAMEGERVACGTAHPDNVAPALWGGLVLVRPGSPPPVTPLPVPVGIVCVLLHPRAEVATEAARSVLPERVPLADLVGQAGDLAALVAGLFREDEELIASALRDRVAEPVRAGMTPGFAQVRAAALAAGALGAGLSGSGPTMFALCSRARAKAVADAMSDALTAETALAGELLITRMGAEGARLLAPASSP